MIKNSIGCFLFACVGFIHVHGQQKIPATPLVVKMEAGEQWWGGAVAEAHRAPFGRSLVMIEHLKIVFFPILKFLCVIR